MKFLEFQQHNKTQLNDVMASPLFLKAFIFKYFDTVCCLKLEVCSGSISFEVHQNDNWIDNIELNEPPFYFNKIENYSYNWSY